jgi:hypothetical protein
VTLGLIAMEVTKYGGRFVSEMNLDLDTSQLSLESINEYVNEYVGPSFNLTEFISMYDFSLDANSNPECSFLINYLDFIPIEVLKEYAILAEAHLADFGISTG